jgi:hypothetical protein
MPPKKGPSTPNKPPKNPNWTLDEGEEMRRDINELQKKMDSMEAKLDTKMDSMEAKIMDPITWILQMEQFFDLHNVPHTQKVRIAQFFWYR